jgi:uncharacterized protein YcbK (DUF882 family)
MDSRSTRVQMTSPSRRRLLQMMGLTALGCLVPARVAGLELATNWRTAPAHGESTLNSTRTLALHNTHTGEFLLSTFWRNGQYDRQALADIDHILRDHRTDQIKAIDPGLLDLLATLVTDLGAREPIQIVSGYRSPVTNANLRQRGRGVAKNSLHTVGKAADIKIPGISLSRLRRAALDLRAGGVGYYPRSGFVHVDVGAVRSW